MKKIFPFAATLLVICITIMAAAPKPGPSVTLNLINKDPNTPAYITLTGITNFYEYYFTAKAYAVEAQSRGDGLNPLPGTAKTQVSVYEVRQDRYEYVVTMCGSIYNAGVIDLMNNRSFVFPLCAKLSYGKNPLPELLAHQQVVCMRDPTNLVCQKSLLMLSMHGNEGEDKVKMKKPPSTDGMDFEIIRKRQ